MDKFVKKTGVCASLDSDAILQEREKVDAAYKEYYDLKRKKPYPDDYVFDENNTVRWNREEVQRRNCELNAKVIDAQGVYKSLDNSFHIFLLKEVHENYGFTREMTEEIWGMAYEESHSSGYREVLNTFENLLDFTLKMIQIAMKE